MLPLEPIGNKKVKQKKDLFYKFIDEHKKSRFVICTHDNPDPDAIASGFGIMRILNFFGIEVFGLFYCGEISHPQNRAMQNILNIPLQKWNKATEQLINHEDIFIFVDSTGNNQKNMSIPFNPKIVIDHHKLHAPKDILFIHDEVGACSTLVTDLMLSAPPISDSVSTESSFCFDPDHDDMSEIITALAVGIKSDTIDFRRDTTTEDDFRAYKLLSKFLSEDRFSRISNYELPSYTFDYEEIAWKNRVQVGPNLITGLGYLDISRTDVIPYLADKMMRLQGVQTVVVYAVVNNTVRGSIRTVSTTVDADTLCTELFGDGNGGGKHGSAGATVPVTFFNISEFDENEKSQFWTLTKSTIEGKFTVVAQK